MGKTFKGSVLHSPPPLMSSNVEDRRERYGGDTGDVSDTGGHTDVSDTGECEGRKRNGGK